MWIKRTPEEVSKWRAATEREARIQGLMLGGGVWLLISIVLAGGWIAGNRMGIVAQQSVLSGTFWSRLPIFAVAGLPFGYWLFRRERKSELERALTMTICPKCEATSEGNAGSSCACGGGFVFQSTMRWVDEPEQGPH